jgi:hypothetical protein
LRGKWGNSKANGENGKGKKNKGKQKIKEKCPSERK